MVKAREFDKKQKSIFYNVEDEDDEEEGPEFQSKKMRSLSMESDDDSIQTSKYNNGEESVESVESSTCDKETKRKIAARKIADFLYIGGIDLNVVKLDSFKKMIESIGECGPNLIPPSEHELRGPILRKEIAYTNEFLKDIKNESEKSGCSVLFDGWTDEEGRTLINILVNNAKGTMFLKTVDASSYIKSENKLFKLLDKYVEHVGEKNVVQVITRTDNNYAIAGKLLQGKRPHLFWTPCAAHCIESMLEDICEMPIIKKTISKGIALVSFIYNYASVLRMMRFFTGNKELAKHGVTRFTTTFLTLQSLQRRQQDLRRMFSSKQWSDNRWSKDAKGKKANDIVFMPTFWNNVAYILRVMSPLVMVLRIAVNEKTPAMGFIYEAMDRAKETILKSFDQRDKCEKVLEIIDERWKDLLHHPLHVAGYYLNPYFYYHDPKIDEDVELMERVFKCLEILIESKEVGLKIIIELQMYKKSESLFRYGTPYAIRGKDKSEEQRMAPVDWWIMFGGCAPNLQEFAVRILSLACSASCCERNWSIFERMHSKKWNKPEYKKLRDVVYVKYNQTLKANAVKKKIKRDPLRLTNISEFNNEWLLEEEINAGDEHAFDDVAEASNRTIEETCSKSPGKSRGDRNTQPSLPVDEESEDDRDVDVFVDDDDESDIDERVDVEHGIGEELQEFSD